jgi:lysophospholipase L1-like esterase
MVGSNDLVRNTPDAFIEQMKDLIQICEQNLPRNQIHIMPAFIRLDNENYNKKLAVCNLKLLSLQHVLVDFLLQYFFVVGSVH